MDSRLLSYIKIDPEVLDGQPYIVGSTITVVDILGYFAAEMTIEEILGTYPPLTPIHIQAALEYAAYVVERVHQSGKDAG